MSQRGAAEGIIVLLLVVGAALHFALKPDYGVRNLEYAPNMVETPGYEAHDANPNFADGMTLRVPAEGTIPRGLEPLHVDGTPLDVGREWEELDPAARALWDRYTPTWAFDQLPADEQKRLLARGAAVFANVCAVCHGPGGTSGSQVTARGVPLPPSLLDPKIVAMSDGHLFHVITLGKGAIRAGKGNMAAHANHVTRADRWKVIRYVRKLQEAVQ